MTVFGDYNTPGDDPRNFPQQPSPLAARYQIGRAGAKSLAEILRGSLVSGLNIHPVGMEESRAAARAAAGLPPEEIKSPQSNVAPTDETRVDRSGVNPDHGPGYPSSVPLANSTPSGPRSFSETIQANMAKTLGQHPYSTAEGPLRSAETPAASTKPSMRAVRLPSGKILFTNQDYGGDEFVGGTAAAGAEIRSQDRARNQQDPVGRTLLSLIRSSTGDLTNASRMQAAVRGEGVGEAAGPPALPALPALAPTRRVTGSLGEFNSSPGGYSQIEGTDQQKQELALESGDRELALAQMGQAHQAASMKPGELADVNNPRIRLAQFLNSQFKPEFDEVNKKEAATRAQIATLPPEQQKAATAEMEAGIQADLRSISRRMAGITGQAIPEW